MVKTRSAPALGRVCDALLRRAGVKEATVLVSTERWACPSTDLWSEAPPRSLWVKHRGGRLRLDVPETYDPQAEVQRLASPIEVCGGGRGALMLSYARVLFLDAEDPAPEGDWTHVIAGLHRFEEVLALSPANVSFTYGGDSAPGVALLRELFTRTETTELDSLSVHAMLLGEAPTDPVVVRVPPRLQELELSLELDADTLPLQFEGLADHGHLLRFEVSGLELLPELPKSLRALVVDRVRDAQALVEQCPSLELLKAIVDKHVDRLGALQSLRMLEIAAPVSTIPEAWRQLQDLRHLSLDAPYDLMEVEALADLERLDSLVLSGDSDWVGLYGGCGPLARAPALRTLVLWAIRKVNGLADLRASSSLTHVVWVRDDGVEDQVDFPDGLPNAATNLWAFGRSVATEAGLCAARNVPPTRDQLERWKHRLEDWLDLVEPNHLADIAAALWQTGLGGDAGGAASAIAEALLRRATVDEDLAAAVLEHVDLDAEIVWDLIEELSYRARDRPRVALQLLLCAARYSRRGGREDRVAWMAREWMWDDARCDEIRVPVGVLARKHGWPVIIDETLGDLWPAETDIGTLLSLLQSVLSDWHEWCELAGLVGVGLVERVEIGTAGHLPGEVEWTRLREIARHAGLTLVISEELLRQSSPGERAALATRLRDSGATLLRVSADADAGVRLETIVGTRSWLAEGADRSPDGRWSDVLVRPGDPAATTGGIVGPADLLASGLVEVPVRAFDPRPIGEVGAWFWSRLRQRADTLDRLVRNGPLRKVSYEDRYLNTPLLARLLHEVLAELVRSGRLVETTELEITTCPSRPEEGSGLVQHRWASSAEQTNVLLALARRITPRADVRARDRKHVTHHRHLTLEWVNEEVVEIFLDRGLDFLTPCEQTQFDASAPVDEQAEALLSLDFKVRRFESEARVDQPALIFVQTH